MNSNTKYTVFGLLSLACCLLYGCGEDRTYEYEAWTQKNRVMQEVMREWYIWGDGIKDQEWKDYFGDATDFFKKLISSSNPNDTWSYCMVDSSRKDCHERGTFNHIDSYGIDYTTMSDPTRLTSQTLARVLTVYDGSPAKECGLERGEFISHIDGEKVTAKNVSLLKNGGAHRLIVNRLSAIGDSLVWQSEREVTIGASRKVDDVQVPVARVFTKKTDVIGYVMINHLNGDGYKDVLREFNQTDVLVVDFRLCNDGTLENARALASCLVDESKYGETFCTSVWKESKKEQNQTLLYDPDFKPFNPCVKSVCFITSAYTSGAAEWVIYGLRHSMGDDFCRTFGVTSKGQNVTIKEFPTEFGYTLGLSVAYITDGDGNYDYGDGIAPDVDVNEYQYVRFYPYGDKDEIVLSTVIDNI